MADITSALILFGLFFALIGAVALYYYGVKKGLQQATESSNLTSPSLKDITIVGKYLVQKQTIEQIVNQLIPSLNRKGYSLGFHPNLIIITNRLESEPASKKKKYFDKLAHMRNGYPDELKLQIHPSPNSETKFLEITAMCTPVMYKKMAQTYRSTFSKSHVEDAQRLCKDLMIEVMSILNAQALAEPYVESSIKNETNVELLLNSLTDNSINEKSHELIANTKGQILIAGWIDREFIGELEAASARGINIKILTKNAAASDPLIREDFGRLIALFGKNVRINQRFHDRFLICDNIAILGSMYYVSASKTRYESVALITEENVVNRLKRHFQDIWDDPNSQFPSEQKKTANKNTEAPSIITATTIPK